METSIAAGLVDGPTAFILWRWRYRFTTITVASCGVLAVLSRSGVPQTWYVNVLGVVMMLGGLGVIVLINWCAVRDRAEKKAGYTTVRLGNRKLMQRDPYMGHIIRLADANYLDRQHFSGILERTKAEAKRSSPSRQRP